MLAGLIIGFMFANSVNQSAATRNPAVMNQTQNPNMQNPNMPQNHPDINSMNTITPEIQAAIDKAKAEPDNFEAQIKAAEGYYQISRFNESIEFLKQANKLKPDDYETIVNLANAYFDSAKYDDAEKWYSSALTKKSDDVNVRTDLGLTFIFRQTPNYDRAIQEFLRSLEIDPNHVQTLQNLTVAYTKKNDLEKAKATLSKLEGLNANNPAVPKLREEIQKLEKK